MKIVLDTNSLIQSVPRQSRYHIVWESLVKGEHVLCVSNDFDILRQTPFPYVDVIALAEFAELLKRM